MLESNMDIEDQWLARFKQVVQSEIDAAGGHHRSGYRAAAAKLHKSEEYVYQLFNDKPEGRAKRPGAKLMDRVEAVYGKPATWPAQEPQTVHEVKSNPLPYLPQQTPAPSELAQAFRTIAAALVDLDATGRRQAVSVLSNLVDDPAACDRLCTLFDVIATTGKRRAA